MKKILFTLLNLVFFLGFAQTPSYQTVTLTNSGKDASLLVFDTERPWVLKQAGTGPSTHLQLHNISGPNKHFQIKTDGGFHLLNQSDSYNTYLSANGGISYIGNLGGNLGIGTTNPQFKLQIGNIGFANLADGLGIKGSYYSNGMRNLFRIEPDDISNHVFGISYNHDNSKASLHFATDPSQGSNFIINEDGNTGIGTTTPDSKLDIENKGDGKELLRFTTERPWVFRQTSSGSTSQLDLHSTVGNKNFKITSLNNNRAAQFLVSDTPDENKVFLVPDGGSVGIGTTNFFGYKLAVNGTIGSTEVKVENTSAWPDFVFETNYDLKSLEEVESFITQNKHLPEIPSQTEVEENGINLGEMDAKLLQKIEELTLYMIEINKRVSELETENSLLKKKLSNVNLK